MNAMETEDVGAISYLDSAERNGIENEYAGNVSTKGCGDCEEMNAGCVDGGEASSVDIGNTGETGIFCPRAKHNCPFPSCKASVVHLPRHMRQVHGWSKVDSTAVLGTFDLRNPRPGPFSAEKKRKHARKVCPVPSCGSIIKRIHNHLAQKHKIKRGRSPRFVKLVKKTEKYEPAVVDCEMTSSHESSVNSSDENQSEDQWKMKNPSSSKVYETVYDSEDSVQYDWILNNIVKGGGKKGGKDVDDRSYDEGKCGGGDCGDGEGKCGSADCDDEDIGGDEYDGGYCGGGEFGGEDNVSGGEKFGGGDSDVNEFGGGVSGDKGSYGGNEKRCTENVGDSVDVEGDNDGGTAAANLLSNVDDKVLLSNFKDWLSSPDGGRKYTKCAQ
ncbi:Hypothetical predicted protein [Paramuricea clavata]|uniref:Uncharacterized protein n=1 Tax=Paramuricea clavata TaxID=317549 RepID=A0A6S7G207_PARCT|nr:Hypothetical predicted protein [Paramuricea clavata]